MPKRSAFSMTIRVAFGTFTPTSMTVVDTSTPISFFTKASMMASFSVLFIFPCKKPTLTWGIASCSCAEKSTAAFI